MKKLTEIDQTGIKALLRERLEQPELFRGRPLIIWRAEFHDGIQERIVHELLIEYNRERPGAYKKGFIELTELTDPDIENVQNLGLCVFNPSLAFIDKENSWSDYCKSVESLSKGDTPIVTYMCCRCEGVETPEAFGDAEQFVFSPDFAEWERWAQSNNYPPQYVLDFIRGTGEKSVIAYRWYNYFNIPSEEFVRKGCSFPQDWLESLSRLKFDKKLSNAEALSDLSDEDIHTDFVQGISPDLVNEFITYIRQNKL